MPGEVARRFLVQGQVQGVGFRWFIQRRLRELGCAGWVRNLPDGSVEAVVGGTPEAMDLARGFLQTGPRSAQVSRVEEETVVPPDPLPRPFRIE
jgi:acylphosphatase